MSVSERQRMQQNLTLKQMEISNKQIYVKREKTTQREEKKNMASVNER